MVSVGVGLVLMPVVFFIYFPIHPLVNSIMAGVWGWIVAKDAVPSLVKWTIAKEFGVDDIEWGGIESVDLRSLVTMISNTARQQLQSGMVIRTVAFVGKVNGDRPDFSVVLMDSASPEAKDFSAQQVRYLAKQSNADFVLLMSEAFLVKMEAAAPEDAQRQHDEIKAKYGSISNHPDREDSIFFTLETFGGTWIATAPITGKAPSRSFTKALQFMRTPDNDIARFNNFLPKEKKKEMH
jgi:hypothetical protein